MMARGFGLETAVPANQLLSPNFGKRTAHERNVARSSVSYHSSAIRR